MWFESRVAEVRALSPEEFFVMAMVLAAVAAFSFYSIWRNLHRARVIDDTPTARLRSAPQGYVELEGFGALLQGTPIVARLTGTHCLWYHFTVERRQTHVDSKGRSHTTWVTEQSGTSDELFMFRDPTGECVIDPYGAEVIPGVTDIWYGATPWPTAGSQVGARRWFSNNEYRYTEQRLMPGPLYAIGWFQTVGDADVPVRAEVTALLREWKADQAQLRRRFDVNGDGNVDAVEWEAARAAALRQVVGERAQNAPEKVTHTLRNPAQARKPYILSATPQRALSRRFRRRSALSLAALVIATGVLLWALVARSV